MDKTLKKIEPLIESYWDSMTDTEQTIAHFFITNTSEKRCEFWRNLSTFTCIKS